MPIDYPGSELDSDPNIQKFSELAADQKWVLEYKGQYVVISEGELIGIYPTEQAALTEGRRKKPNAARFVHIIGYETVLHEEGGRFVYSETVDSEKLKPKIN